MVNITIHLEADEAKENTECRITIATSPRNKSCNNHRRLTSTSNSIGRATRSMPTIMRRYILIALLLLANLFHSAYCEVDGTTLTIDRSNDKNGDGKTKEHSEGDGEYLSNREGENNSFRRSRKKTSSITTGHDRILKHHNTRPHKVKGKRNADQVTRTNGFKGASSTSSWFHQQQQYSNEDDEDEDSHIYVQDPQTHMYNTSISALSLSTNQQRPNSSNNGGGEGNIRPGSTTSFQQQRPPRGTTRSRRQRRYMVKFKTQEEFSVYQWNNAADENQATEEAYFAEQSKQEENTNIGGGRPNLGSGGGGGFKGSGRRPLKHLSNQRTSVLLLEDDEALEWQTKGFVEYIEEDVRRFSNTLLKGSETQMNTNNDNESNDDNLRRSLQQETTPWGLNMIEALDVDDTYISNRKVCIIDSGYDMSHPDLPNSSKITGTSQISNESWSINDGDFNHGVHVAGIITALGNNSKGTMGVIRNGQMPLHIIKIFNNNGWWTYSSDLIGAIDECVLQANANVINMSLGGSGASNTEAAAFDTYHKDYNVLFVSASGNRGRYRDEYPASYTSVMSVGSIDANKQLTWFSNTSPNLELVAPGVNVYTTTTGGGYTNDLGTSMSCAYVTGIAALIWSHFPTKASAQQIRDALTIGSALDLGSTTGWDVQYGHGLVQALGAYNYLLDTLGYDDTVTSGGGGGEGGGGGGGGNTPSPTSSPSSSPTSSPSSSPTSSPSSSPTSSPSSGPTSQPSSSPTSKPSASPTSSPVVDNVSSPTPPPTPPLQSPPTPAPVPATPAPVPEPPTAGDSGGGGGGGGGGGTGICQNDPPNWYDLDGPYFNCDWYATGSNCEDWGSDVDYANFGKTGNEACCACGGGITT